MPTCLNDPKKKYKGDEPSPKGVGYAAHAEHLGTIRMGRDGNKWIVTENNNGVRRWVKNKD